MFLLNVLMVLIQGNNAASLVQGLVLNVYFEQSIKFAFLYLVNTRMIYSFVCVSACACARAR